jgi:hypothetical protein
MAGDNYGIHSAHRTRKMLAALGSRVVLHFLPRYCPDANRIERVWQDFHANVTRNHRCKAKTRLLDNARLCLDSYAGAGPRSTPSSHEPPDSRSRITIGYDRSFRLFVRPPSCRSPRNARGRPAKGYEVEPRARMNASCVAARS